MLDKPKSMSFQEGGGNLVVTVDDIGANWRSKPQDNYKVSKNARRSVVSIEYAASTCTKKSEINPPIKKVDNS